MPIISYWIYMRCENEITHSKTRVTQHMWLKFSNYLISEPWFQNLPWFLRVLSQLNISPDILPKVRLQKM